MLLLLFSLLLQSTSGISYLQEPISQTKTSRNFLADKAYHQVDSVYIDSMYNAGIIKSFRNSVYVLDYSPYPVVKKIDLNSKSVTLKYGNGRGRGPGELINPTDFGITEGGRIWIPDEPQSKVSIFGDNGELYDEWVIQFTPYKIAGYNENIAILGSFDPAIKLVDSSQNVLWTSNYVVENPKRWANLVTGFILSDRNKVFKIANYAGTLIIVSDEGEIQHFKKQIDSDQEIQGTPISGLEYLSYQLDRSELKYAVASGCITGDEIHLLVQYYGDNSRQVVDVYSAVDAEYLYSYRLSKSVRSITALDNGTIVGLRPDHIIMWEKSR